MRKDSAHKYMQDLCAINAGRTIIYIRFCHKQKKEAICPFNIKLESSCNLTFRVVAWDPMGFHSLGSQIFPYPRLVRIIQDFATGRRFGSNWEHTPQGRSSTIWMKTSDGLRTIFRLYDPRRAFASPRFPLSYCSSRGFCFYRGLGYEWLTSRWTSSPYPLV